MTQVTIPTSNSTVSVSAIDSESRIFYIHSSSFAEPVDSGIPHFTFPPSPAYAFLIEHAPSGKRILFDLGIRKDLQNLAPRNQKVLERTGWRVYRSDGSTELLDVKDILEKEHKDTVDAIVWSHWHWDHTGDPTRFSKEVKLVVGPGFKDKIMPGYPSLPESGVTDDAWHNRPLRELDFVTESKGLKIGGFEAIDYFGDGSFYLLSTPGHAIGHLSALVRTKALPNESFAFLGADICHHCSEFRPTEFLPCPQDLVPDGSKIRTTPYFTLPRATDGKGFAYNREDAVKSAKHLEAFDADSRIWVILAHDSSLLDVLDVFPKNMNDWKEKGWKGVTTWKFLDDLKESSAKRVELRPQNGFIL